MKYNYRTEVKNISNEFSKKVNQYLAENYDSIKKEVYKRNANLRDLNEQVEKLKEVQAALNW